jgi:hypothetical protein
MSAAHNRFKQAQAPEGLSAAAPSLPAQAGMDGRVDASRVGPLSEAAAAANVGATCAS